MPDISVSTTPFDNGSDFNPKDSDAATGGNVKLTAAAGDGTLSVYTYMKNGSGSWVLTDVFTGDRHAPYNAPEAGKTYTLKPGLQGRIKLYLSPQAEVPMPQTPTNGTINVGGGGGGGTGGEPPR